MKTSPWKSMLAAQLGCVLLAPLLALAAPEDLARGFSDPPPAAKPRVYWWWLMSCVSPEGITRDLEEMAAKGIGGVLLFDAAGSPGPMPQGPAFMSPAWREHFRHALREADRLGLEVSVNLCSGWDAGGPWITPEQGSKHFQQSTWNVSGPRRFSGKLPRPVGDTPAFHQLAIGAGLRPAGPRPAEPSRYRELAVQAVPRKPLPGPPQVLITASSCQPAYPPEHVADGMPGSFWVSGGYQPGDAPTREKPEWIRLDFGEPFTARSLRLMPHDPYGPREAELQALDATGTFRTVQSFRIEPNRTNDFAFPATTARSFRLRVTSSFAAENTQISELRLGDMPPLASALPPQLALKSGRDSFHGWGESGPIRGLVDAPLADPDPLGDRLEVAPESILDLTAQMGADGELDWDVPAGEWTLVRTGYAFNHDQILCASPGGAGPTLDFLSASAMDFHFQNTAARLLQDAGPLAGKTLKYFHDDSWEVGLPNWTDSFLEDFKAYRGYDARPYLPVLAGVVVGNVEISDRFLYDYRRTVADCIANHHYARFAQLAQAGGVQIHCEAGGPCYPKVPPLDALMNLGRTAIPMGEFWQSGHWKEQHQNLAGKQTAAAAHVYGKTFAAAEAFTKIGPHWEECPADLKPTADIAFCEGINRFFLHTWTSTRPEDGVPGYEYFAGTHFNRNVTWWPQAGAFFTYLSRCQFLLQQGLFVADVCYYYGDHAPNKVEVKHVDPSLGPGYDYDVCNAEVLLTRLEVRDGRIVLPDGMSYRLLVLPDRRTMPVEVLRKIRSLVDAGATVVGPKPVRAPGLKHYPQADAEVKQLADDLWGEAPGGSGIARRYGQGRVYEGRPLRAILAADGVPPAFEYEGGTANAFLDFIHRRTADAEIFFVCNRNGRSEAVEATFRVSGKLPELWDAVTGDMRPAVAFRPHAGRTVVPLEFGPYGSTFVVFRQAVAATAAGVAARNYPAWAGPVELTGDWAVAFDPRWGGPASVRFAQLVSWPEREEPGIKYYSGKATYRKTFDLPDALRAAKRIRLNLGSVKQVAEVRLNGRDLGVVWAEPFQVEITEAVRVQGNRLEIDVINLWPNRMIGDAALPADQRLTRSNVAMDRNAKLLPSGLLGPVSLQPSREVAP